MYVQGGDLMNAIAADSKNLLRWSRKGHMLAMDIAKGLVHLHANKVPLHPSSRYSAAHTAVQESISSLMGYMSLHLHINTQQLHYILSVSFVLVNLFAECVCVSVYCD